MRRLPTPEGSLVPRPRRRFQWGQGLTEFALVLPILLLIILFIIEAALIIQGYLAVAHAAREAARWATTNQPVQGYKLDGTPCDNPSAGDGLEQFLFNNPGYNCDPYEDTDEYNARRVALIKEIALERAVGLRINEAALGLTNATFEAYIDQPGFFGVRVWGFPSFEEAEQPDHPGLPGLPVRVQVVYNVEILDPLFGLITEYVQVQAHTEMINEGIQVGFGNLPPPTFQPLPTYGSTPGDIIPTATDSDTGPTPSPTLEPTDYNIEIGFDRVVNTLPLQRSHNVTVTVTDNEGDPLSDVLVSFSTNLGSYDYSGVDAPYVEDTTDDNGVVIQTVYANRPGTANLEVWIDLDGDDLRDPGEPYDTATKEWLVQGPYVLASDHEVLPLDWITVDIYDHPPAQEPYRLLWCRTSITGGIPSAVLLTNIDVDDVTWSALDLPVEIPNDSEGYYQLETHTATGDCGDQDTLLAFSAEIYVPSYPPDLHVQSISYPPEYGDRLPSNTEVPLTIVVENLSPTGLSSTYFDVDLYVDPDDTPPPAGRIGTEKQWLDSIQPYGTEVVTVVVTLPPGIHELWAQVDTTNYIEEADEGNNISGPFSVEVACTADSSPYGDDFDDGVFDSKWTLTQVGTPDVNGSVSESGGRLTINARGLRIWGSGNDENFYYVHQSVSGDFDARLRILYGPNLTTWSKMGLMVRNSTASNSRHVMAMYTYNHRYIQFAYRPSDGADTERDISYIRINVPMWVRIVRTGDTFQFCYSASEDPGLNDWNCPGSVTVDMDDSVLVGIAHATYRSQNDDGAVDEFVICQDSGAQEEDIKPPGLLECSQLLQIGGFEGNPQTVFSYWHAGEAEAYRHTGYLQHTGAFAMRLHASLGSYPACAPLHPYLYQTVQIPTEIYTLTRITVEGWRAVAGSLTDCSYPDSPDTDDVLYAEIRDGSGNPISGSVPLTVTDGGAPLETWQRFSLDFTDGISLTALAGQQVRVRYFATQDDDEYGTFFYLDDLECNICTQWPIPDPEPGMATFGGMVRTLISGVPHPLTNADVWAYSRGGEVYHTRSIHDGTYHFYNVPPGTYTIYAEAWVGGHLRVDTATVTVVADEQKDNIHLLLQ